MSPIPGSNEPAKIFPYKIKEPAKTFFSQKSARKNLTGRYFFDTLRVTFKKN